MTPRPVRHVTVVGAGLAGLTAAITAAEGGARVTLYEAHRTPGGRARTAEHPYRTNEGPHALYRRGPHWSWLAARGLLGPMAPLPAREGARFRFHRDGALRRTPPLGLLRLARRSPGRAPVDLDFATWAGAEVGPAAARAATHYSGVALFHHDPGSLSARFVQERLHRSAALPPEARYPRGGWGRVVERMAARARELGVRLETGARVDTLPGTADGPVVVATSLAAARRLLGDPSLTWESGRTALLDLALRTREGDPFVVSDLDAPGWLERFTAQDPTLAPAGRQLLQGQFPVGPGASRDEGLARAERLLDLGFPGWRDRMVWRRDALATGRTGAVDRPGTTWRDRPAIARGDGVFLAGDAVAAPGVLAEVAFTSGREAALLALGALDAPAGRGTRHPASRTP
ncbi:MULTISPECIES: phytoene desaturase family protein [Streptomyces]|uniref:FAD-dependent oxidoreductase n=2 Tax=Streptomyces TaxID=1883 RepID=A0A100Y2M3_9ACTN|nr:MULTISPECIES: FAD-dependent oxidoreductase [Streptomyces]KUH36551.1 FAD-dependent oxidoreductase [Streptomyces kanasensis]UUS31753.1 FAD-dependent oxidoreductase [Streptomyces changanensis]